LTAPLAALPAPDACHSHVNHVHKVSRQAG
jgi:hypothetical protein